MINNNSFNNKEISFRYEFFFLSNLYPCNFIYNGLKFKSSEHLYQYLKVEDSVEGLWWKDKIRNAEHPKIAKKLANNPKMPKKFKQDIGYNEFSNFKYFKIHIMRIALEFKFFHSDESKLLQTLLLETFDIEIIERNTWKDVFWGVYSKTNMGQNHLGELLMEIRNKLLLELK